MLAHQSKSSQFVERWSKAEYWNIRLLRLCYALSAGSMLLIGGLVYMITKPKPIYLIPSVWQAGSALPISRSPIIAASFGASWVLDWSNFNPSTAENVNKRAQQLMSPYLLSKTKARLKQNLEEIKREDISSSFSITNEPEVQRVENGYGVRVKGRKVVFIGKEIVKEEDIVFKLRVLAVNPTTNNPFGLTIDNIEQETQ